MKTFKNIANAIIIIAACILFHTNKITAQSYVSATFTTTCYSYTNCYGSMDFLESQNQNLAIMGGGVNCSPGTLNSLGINNYNPQYIADILAPSSTICGGNPNGVNISDGGTNQVGYNIGGQMVLWHDGDLSSLYAGVGAGFNPGIGIGGSNNTFIGSLADESYNGAFLATNNTAIGSQALMNNVSHDNLAIGVKALYSITGSAISNSMFNVAVGNLALMSLNVGTSLNPGIANANTAIGYGALENFNPVLPTPYSNTAVGFNALVGAISGIRNTAIGNSAESGLHNGNDNSAMGDYAMAGNMNGSGNTAVGSKSLLTGSSTSPFNNTSIGFNTLGGNSNISSNTAVGANSLALNLYGNKNTGVGDSCLWGNNFGDSNSGVGTYALVFIGGGNGNSSLGYASGSNSNGNDNTFLGANTNPLSGYSSIFNSTAIGYGATVVKSSNMILGNNFVNVGIGMSGFLSSPADKLEISYYSNASNSDYNAVSPGYETTCGSYTITPTGASGLQFRDLTDNSTPFPYCSSHPFLTVDDSGYVILMAPCCSEEERMEKKIVSTQHGTLYQTDAQNNWNHLDMIIGNSFNASADNKYRTDVSGITNALSIIKGLNGQYFNWNNASYPYKHFAGIQQVGFDPLNVNAVLPQVVSMDDSSDYTIDYSRIVPVLVEAMKQQQQTIDSLRNILIPTTGQIPSTTGNVQDVAFSSSPLGGQGVSPILYQNSPNPFGTGGTKINYYLPEGSPDAAIVFYDNYGNELKEVPLTQTGNGTLNINPDNLSNGIYSYSLLVEGKIVDTKKMILAK